MKTKAKDPNNMDQTELRRELNAIKTHLEEMIYPEEMEEFGINEEDPLHMKVFKVLSSLTWR